MVTSRILVVEDERIVAKDLELRLQALGYEVVGLVATGLDAVRLADELRPDLVMMDIQLQGEMEASRRLAGSAGITSSLSYT